MSSPLALTPIGFLRTNANVKFAAPHQPNESENQSATLELLPGFLYEQALQDLAGFSRIWLIWWFHRTHTWRPMVQPPRGPKRKRGLFATRSPHRPNPLGLTSVPLLGIKGRTLLLGAHDLIDGTPIFDIKPYVPNFDAFGSERSGWIQEVDDFYATPPRFEVQWSELALVQFQWLKSNWHIDFRTQLTEILERDPSPHSTRRIKRHPSGAQMIGCGAWRGVFSVHDNIVKLSALEPGYPLRFLVDPGRAGLPDQEAQLAFLKVWPEGF
jgi:tRNA (adenine37-N6)-methyltransferase